jgi:SAM-dependent methyltransferase
VAQASPIKDGAIELSIVMPVLNEEGAAVEAVKRALDCGLPLASLEIDEMLARSLDGETAVTLIVDALPKAPSLIGRSGSFDLVVCHHVLEHIDDDIRTIEMMSEVLAPGGVLSLLVPARPCLFGSLDDAYGDWRRYTRVDLQLMLTEGGLKIQSIPAQNSLGIIGWWTKNRSSGTRVGQGHLPPMRLS